LPAGLTSTQKGKVNEYLVTTCMLLVSSASKNPSCALAAPNHDNSDQTSTQSAAMLFWALLASGQITLRKVDGWASLAEPFAEPIDLAA